MLNKRHVSATGLKSVHSQHKHKENTFFERFDTLTCRRAHTQAVVHHCTALFEEQPLRKCELHLRQRNRQRDPVALDPLHITFTQSFSHIQSQTLATTHARRRGQRQTRTPSVPVTSTRLLRLEPLPSGETPPGDGWAAHFCSRLQMMTMPVESADASKLSSQLKLTSSTGPP